MNDTADEADVVFNYTVSKYKNLWVVPDMVQFERVNCYEALKMVYYFTV